METGQYIDVDGVWHLRNECHGNGDLGLMEDFMVGKWLWKRCVV